MTIQDITSLLESIAPLSFQEDYDNAGLITGDKKSKCTGVLVCLDTTEDIIDEAIANKCNMVVAHHPIIFSGLRQLTGKNYVERIVIKAIRNDIAIYAIHTNLDNIKSGVNNKIAEKLFLTNLQVLRPKGTLLKKMVTYAPIDKAEEIRQTLFHAGAGEIGNYSECSFNLEGTGTFKANAAADPFVEEVGKRHEEKEVRIEVIFQAYLQVKITEALIAAHPYEEVAYDIYSLSNYFQDVGSGLVGSLPHAVSAEELLTQLSGKFNVRMLRHTRFSGKSVSKIALCGGAGIFLLKDAIARGADAFITSDVKYHEFFDADGQILLVDMGHFESEQFTIELLFEILSSKFPNFAILKTGIITNPVHYFG